MVNVFVNRYNGKCLNGLQVNERVLCREFTKSLIFRDFDDLLKNPFRYVHFFLFVIHIIINKKNSEHRHAIPVTEGPKLRCNTSHCTRVWPL